MKRIIQTGLLFVAAALMLSGCNCYKKMAKNVTTVTYQCTPELLVLNNGTVTATITVNFPPKYFNEQAVLKLTPVLVFEGGEIAGAPKYIQGERVKDNYTVIPYVAGGSYTQTVTFPYDERARISELIVRVEAMCSKKCSKKYNVYSPIEEGSVVVARGINTLQRDFNFADAMQPMADNFKKSETVSARTEVLYKINQANLPKNALSDEQAERFRQFVADNMANEKAETGKIYVKGYASPDGPEKFNDKLSGKRSETGKKAAEEKLSGIEGISFDAAAYGEDWEGFQELVASSALKDKDLILQVLRLYDSPAKREAQIKEMSEVYSTLKNEVLPQLRRSQIISSAEIAGKTDAELRDFVKRGNLKELTVEELLYAGTLYEGDAKTQTDIYRTAARKYDDARAWNNLGVALAEQGDYGKAAEAFAKAADRNASAEVNNNLVLSNLAAGKVNEAKRYTAGATAETKAFVAAQEGNYAAASTQMKGYNAALANYMNGNLNAAKRNLQGDNSARAEYLRAVIASNEGDTNAAKAYLKSAVAKDKSLAEKARTDVNLVNIAR